MTKPRDNPLVVVGSMNVDLTVRTRSLPNPGETVVGRGISRGPGGKGSNQAVAAARLGAKPVLVAALGADEDGAFLREAAAKQDVNIDLIRHEQGSATGTALITVDDAAENFIVVSPGANARLTPEIVQRSLFEIGKAAVLCLSLEVPVDTALAAARTSAAMGAITVLNLSPYSPEAMTIMPLVDVAVLNEGEALAAVGLRVLPSERPWQVIGALLGEAGAKNAVITLGAEGAIVLENLQRWPISPIHIQPTRVRPTDTSGCGDAFAGAMAGELAHGTDLLAAVRFASKVAAYAATGRGTQGSYPTRGQLQEWLEQGETGAVDDVEQKAPVRAEISEPERSS
ncbi:ribokinase [Pseudarthrobacter sp. SSS035]|uniref:ribokinase n=1 Tax=Pseudarthrobacter sp. SSS035 TaxID=2931399 RepID=UPI00211251B6|nr:ribokinase [Pseudarthrobacter sp. SSS035]